MFDPASVAADLAEALMGNSTIEATFGFTGDDFDRFKFDVQVEATRLLRMALNATPIGTPVETGEGVVRVLPLVWAGDDNGKMARSIVGFYRIERVPAGFIMSFEGIRTRELFQTAEEAMFAAQGHFDATIKSALEPTPPTEGVTEALSQLRADGWMVAVHNDYRLEGRLYTFWLLTHANGRWIKGEGGTDAEALDTALRAALEPQKPR